MTNEPSDESTAGLRYVRDMLPQLKLIADLPQNAMLNYLLDMARLEVETEINRRADESETGSASQ